MITPEEFPYITSIHVNDCYAYQNFDIELFNYTPKKPFSHLILTGKNGSGKSTVLRGIDACAQHARVVYPGSYANQFVQLDFSNWNPTIEGGYPNNHQLLPFGRPTIREQASLYAHFKSSRITTPKSVETPVKDESLDSQLIASGPELSAKLFKQYLVNRKVAQAFSQLKKQFDKSRDIDIFFDLVKEAILNIFDQQLIELTFEENTYEFYLDLSDGRRLTFDVLNEGYLSSVSVLMDLFIRVDIIRKQINDFSYNPCGIVLIDEPEEHLHFGLQEQIMPILTKFFPNVQFIVATHSPAVVASIKNVTVFDVPSKERRDDEVVGRSYSELMTGHLGLNNEYSSIIDEVFGEIQQIIDQTRDNPKARRLGIAEIIQKNGSYISPTFMVELESMILTSDIAFGNR